jgi:hypothetical protein
LRRRIRGLDEFYRYKDDYIDWPKGLVEKFLSIDNPRPTVRQLARIIEPMEYNFDKNVGYTPDPDRPGYLKYDYSRYIPDPNRFGKMKYNDDFSGPTKYDKLQMQQAQKRIEIMLDILKSRGIDYDIVPIIEMQRKKREEDERQRAKEREELLKLPVEERERLYQEKLKNMFSSIR